ncbi:hypothetical protein HUU59_08315 [bacterium]|nr:hypothetical protein [bacterium]
MGSCILACITTLKDLFDDKTRIVIDDKWFIIGEYKNKLNQSGQPRIGDEFLKWVLTNSWNTSRCQQTPVQIDASGELEGFPTDDELSQFDRSDRKFVVTALAYANHLGQPVPILNAVDSDWWIHKKPLQRVGISIEFLCSDQAARWRIEHGETA